MNVNYKYKSLKDFKKAHPSEYKYLEYKRLLEQLCYDMGWDYLKIKPSGYWTKERCIEEAKKYNTRTEWSKGKNGASTSYNIARQNGWFEECTTHMVEINKPAGYWNNKERCIEEAKKYNTITEWNIKSCSSCATARKNGWFDECTAHMIETAKPNGYWNIKENVLEEAKKYKTRGEWGRKSGSSYLSAKKNGWFDECVVNMEYAQTPANYWTKERVLEEIKKYDSYTQWINKSPNSHFAAKRHGYLDECLIFLPNNSFRWTKELCFEEALKYKSISEWQKNSNGSQKAAKRNGWFEECTTHMVQSHKPAGYWNNKEKCIEEAKKYNTITEWNIKSGTSCATARKNGWFDECTAHMIETAKPKGYWTKERCVEEAKKYSSRSEWGKKSSSSYNVSKKNGWFDECSSHMQYLVKPNGTWTKELLINEAKKWKTKAEWLKQGEGYSRAKALGCFEECTAHMLEINKPAGYWCNKENVLEEAKKYKTRSEWQEKSNGSKKAAKKYGWYDECTAHMK